MNILDLIEDEKHNGYSADNVGAKVCRDLILKAISNSSLNRNVTIKGGVVMRSKTKNIRRATQDLDIDFIKYSLSNTSIDLFIKNLNNINGITFRRTGQIEELSQQDYHGKRVFIQIIDSDGNILNSKIDLGVHVNFDIEQEDYCFDLSFDDEGAILFVNSNEQMFSEKLRSLLKFGPTSTRYKDLFDMYYLIDYIDREKLQVCLTKFIFSDDGMHENNMEDIIRRLQLTFQSKPYQKRINTTNKKWIDVDTNTLFKAILEFLNSITYSTV